MALLRPVRPSASLIPTSISRRPILPLLSRTTTNTSTKRQRRLQALQSRHYVSAYGYEQAKALTFANYGSPPQVLNLHTHSIPPAHSTNLILRFLAAPINPADLNQIQGVYPSKPTFTTALGTPEPLAVAGNEGLAEIMATGSAVTAEEHKFKRGDWVIMRKPGFGTWRTHAQLDLATATAHLMPLSPADRAGISAIQAATVSVNPTTAACLLREFVTLKPGDVVLQNGANGAVGRFVIQLARLWGFRTVNVVRKRDTPEETERLSQELRELGADVVLTHEEAVEGGFAERVREFAEGRGPDGGDGVRRGRVQLALNCVGGKIVNAMAKALDSGSADGGASHVVTYGAMARQPTQLPAGLLIFRDVRFSGFWVSRWAELHPEKKSETVRELLGLMREGKLRDGPVEEVVWTADSKKEELVGAVEGALEGFRKGKGVFVFKDT